MEAVILSGGLGTRMRPLTRTRPKPLLPIANVPMVRYILDALPPEVDRAVLAAGYMVEKLQGFAEGLDHRVELVVVPEDEPLGTAGAIKNVERHITGPFLAFNGDIIASYPCRDLVTLRATRGAVAVLSLWQVDDPEPFGVARLDGDRIVQFVEKPKRAEAPSRLINAGIYCFDHAILDAIPAGRAVSMEREVWPRLLSDGALLLGHTFTGHWVDCGRPSDYLEAHRLVMGSRTALAPGARCDGVVRGFASLESGAVVEAGATVERSVLLARARVAGAAVVTDSVLGEGALVETGAVVQESVLGDGSRVPAGMAVKDARLEPGEVYAHG